MGHTVGTLIYYMIDNKLHSAPILSKMVVENLHPDWDNNLFQPFGKTVTLYATCHGVLLEEQCYTSKELLLENL